MSQQQHQDLPIRPVTGRFPVSQDDWDDTNLPFSCVLTPLAGLQQQHNERRRRGDECDGEVDDGAEEEDEAVESLSTIPKCLHCGAPHASSDTHYRPRGGVTAAAATADLNDMPSALLCFLCGRVSSTGFQQQEEMRAKNEGTLLAGAAATRSSTRSSSSSSKGKAKESPARDGKATNGRKNSVPTVFELPLRLSSSRYHQAAAPGHLRSGGGGHHYALPVFSSPASSCPLLWFVVLDGTSDDPAYWSAASELLLSAVRQIPDGIGVRVSVLLAGQREDYDDEEQEREGNIDGAGESESGVSYCSLGVYQLASPVPHVKHYRSTTYGIGGSEFYAGGGAFPPPPEPDEDLAAAVFESLVEASERSRPRVEAACQSLKGYRPAIRRGRRGQQRRERFCLSWTLELILQALQLYGQATGQRDKRTNLLPYAGGKITCLMASRPAQVASPAAVSSAVAATGCSNRRQGKDGSGGVGGSGGFGGRIAPFGERFVSPSPYGDIDIVADGGYYEDVGSIVDAEKDEDAAEQGLKRTRNGGSNGDVADDGEGGGQDEELDLTPACLQDVYEPPFGAEIVVYYQELGRQMAAAAMGVDLLCLLCGDNDDGSGAADEDDFGLALYGNLSQKSGAPGPLLFQLSPSREGESSSDNFSLLQREFQSRTPWQPNMVFGAELRLRLPPGFGVDDSNVERSKEAGPQLAPLYADQGLLGPGSAVEESTNLWRFGTCDPYTCVTVDLMLQSRNIKTTMFVDGLGDVTIKPVIQTCFAYTTIVPGDEEGDDEGGNNSAKKTKDRYRTVRRMRIHSCPVPFAKDAETLYGSLDNGALSVVLLHKLALASLQDGFSEAAMIAEDWLQSTLTSVYQSAEQHASQHADIKRDDGKLEFYASERLLDREGGELSEDDVLLAQGHEQLRSVPLMTYLLMQCDAFRPTPAATASPSLDLRYAAMSQMMSMPPSILTRCLAPRIQLWASAKDEKEPILDVVDLSTYSIRSAVAEYSANDLILVIDSPDQIAVIDGQYVGPVKVDPSSTPSSSLPLVMGTALKRSIVEASTSYRTRPNILYELSYNEESSDRVIKLLTDVLIEDARSPTGQENYREWKSEMALGVKEELENDANDSAVS